MLFGSLQCTQKGRVRLPAGSRGGAVYADDFGGVWVISEDAQEVLYYAPDTLSAAIEQQQRQACPPLSTHGTSVAPLSTSSPAYAVVFRCDAQNGTADGVTREDRVYSLYSVSRHECIAGSPRRDLCIVTTRGTLAFVRMPANHRHDPPLRQIAAQPYQEVHLDMHVCAATVTNGAVQNLVLCCHDGTFTEVIRVAVVGSAEQLGGVGSAAADTECEVDATGLFRVEGRIEAVLHDSVLDVLVTVSDTGYVDVWDVASAKDVTAMYGSLSWDCDRYGAPTCALLCRDQLWVGLTTGQLLVFPLSNCHGGASPPLLNSAQLLRGHTSRVTGLISVSLATCVWSCAADSAKVNVWDAGTAALRGSFVFPGSGLVAWQAGAAQVRTALWGIDGATGEPSLLQVTQSLPDPNGTQARTREETRAQHHTEALLHAYQVFWRSMARTLRHLLLGEAKDADEGAEEAMQTALQLIWQDASGAGDNRDVLDAIHAMCDTLRRLRAAHRRCDPEGSDNARDLPSLMEACVTWYEQQGRVPHEVEALLRALNASSSEATCLTSLEDVEEEVMLLRARVEELQVELARAGDRRDSDAVCKGGAEATDTAIAAELQDAQAALRDKAEENRELRAQLSEAQREATSLTSQHAHTQQLLDASDEQVEQLKRSLLAAKRAAEVKASDVSSMFEMESRLHESQGAIAELSAKVETLLKEADVARVSLHAFEERQAAAKEVLQRVLRTQNDLADDVGTLVDDVSAAIATFKKRHCGSLTEHAAALVGIVEEALYRLELSVERRLRDEQLWFQSLSHGLKAAMA
ncbi:hypothetical protein, conserved [Leishmania donovani]|uniref:Uncharacterized protein n=1 Tax=Leishmania donovani TaxID=5661 RepID=E9BEG5_LEIDO|nr:hypothetical protein, conserved [Leishmania donovani]TPP49974.1 hypothetical protein CGC21_29700 [Leishmania donovani]CBZ33651.1 hypothetical protein, conserved [Leishmania donovani]